MKNSKFEFTIPRWCLDMTLIFTIVFLLVSIGQHALAQVAGAVAPPTFLDGALNWLKALNPIAVGGVMSVVEIVLRLVPSQKALSILVPVKYVLDGVSTLFGWVSGLVTVLITSLNNVVPPTP